MERNASTQTSYVGGKDRNPEGDIASDARARALRAQGKSTGSNGGTQMGPEGVANPTSSSSAAPTATTQSQMYFTKSGRPLADGTIQTYDDPSLGQVLSALGRLPTGPLGVVSALASIADSDQYGRDLLGRAIDEENGSTPDAGYQGPNRIASNTNSRGDNDTRLMDRASAAARAELSGSTPADTDTTAGGDDGGAEFSSVKLKDRRRPYDDMSAVDLLRGLL